MADDFKPPSESTALEGENLGDKKKLTLKSGRSTDTTGEGAGRTQTNATSSKDDGAPAEGTSEHAISRKRYRVMPKASEKPAVRPRRTGPRRNAKATAQGVKKPGREPAQKKLPDDPDHQWLKRELRAADTVAQVLARQAQFENKIRALKLRHPPERPLYQYAERMEAFLKRLASYPWTAQLRDIRQDDAQIRKLKL